MQHRSGTNRSQYKRWKGLSLRTYGLSHESSLAHTQYSKVWYLISNTCSFKVPFLCSIKCHIWWITSDGIGFLLVCSKQSANFWNYMEGVDVRPHKHFFMTCVLVILWFHGWKVQLKAQLFAGWHHGSLNNLRGGLRSCSSSTASFLL